MALQYRRGSASIEEAATRKSGGFRPFIPQISWREDGEQHYVLVLTDIEEVAELLIHTFVPVGKGKKSNGEEYTRYDDFLSRKMPAIGEDYDDLEDRLGLEAKVRHMGVMVELDPIKNGKTITGFTVKTETFTRKTDDGEVEATAPVIGLCTQSAMLMWGPLGSFAKELGDLITVPLSITKRGTKTNTRYDIIPFMDRPVDLSPVLDYLAEISYIGDDLEAVQQLVDAEDTEVAKTQAVAQFLLEKRINELADPERYEELVSGLEPDDIPKRPWNKKANGNGNGKGESRPSRPARRSPRESVSDSGAEEETPEPSKSANFAALKARVERRA